MDMKYYLKNNYMIWIDTCSILDERFEEMMNASVNALIEYNKKIIVAPAVERELRKHASQTYDLDLCKKACTAISLMYSYMELGVMMKYGESDKSFADNELLTFFTDLRIERNLLLITEDKDLAYAIRSLGKTNAVLCKKINTAKYDIDGNLVDYREKKRCYGSRKNSFNKRKDFNFDASTLFNNCFSGLDDFISYISMDAVGNTNAFIVEGNINETTNGDVYGNINGNVTGVINGDVYGDIYGDVNSIICGDVKGSIVGNVNGVINGDVEGEILGRVNGIVVGDVGTRYGNMNIFG